MEIKLDKKTIVLLSLILVIVMLAILLIFNVFVGKRVNIYFYTPNGNYKDGSYKAGSLVTVEDGPEIDGYTFVCWEDRDGNPLTGSQIYVNEDMYLSAVYSIALKKDDHVVFLENDEGIFRPDEGLTNGECVLMLYKLLDTKLKGEGVFKDVDADSPYYEAAATLKDLGIISGNYLNADEYISKKDFAGIISKLSANYIQYMDDTSSDDILTRSECAEIMCKILGRTGDGKDRKELVGSFQDVKSDREDFWYIAESTVEHEYTLNDGVEEWVSSSELESREPGFYFDGVSLHYIDEYGNPVINGDACGLHFNERGEETSGDDEVDEYVREILEQTIDPETQTRAEMLKALYDYVVYDNHFTYVVRNYYETGDTSWVVDEARTMLEKHNGNCYNFAAVFYELARSIGYDAKIYSGIIGPDKRPHAWVEIDTGDGPLLYDTEYEYANPGHEMFAKDEAFMKRYEYSKEGTSPYLQSMKLNSSYKKKDTGTTGNSDTATNADAKNTN